MYSVLTDRVAVQVSDRLHCDRGRNVDKLLLLHVRTDIRGYSCCTGCYLLTLSLHKWSNRFINNENILSLQPKLRLKHRKPNISDVSSAVRNTDLGMFCHRARPRTTPSPLESPLRHHTDAHRCRRSATKKQEVKSCRQRADQTHQSEARVFVCHTLIPVLVASLTASSSLSYFGLNVTVKAQSMIRPANRHQAERRASLS